jgi:signal transduction histidine kinase
MLWSRMRSPTARPADRRVVGSAVLLALSFLLIAVVPTIFSARLIAVGDQLLEDTSSLGATGRDISRLAVGQESGLRGYVLSGDERFLEPYQTASRSIGPIWTTAGQQAEKVGGAAPGLVSALRAAADEWRAQVAEPAIDLVRAGRRADAATLEASALGRDLGDRVRARSEALLAHVDRLRDDQVAARRSLVRWQTLLLVALALLGTLGLALIYQLATRSERYQVEAEAGDTIIREKDQFLAIAAHELRTPLTSIKGHAQMMLRHGRGAQTPTQADWERALKHASTIDRQSSRLTRLIEQLLEVTGAESKMIDLQREPTDLVALAEQVVEQFRPVAPVHPIRIEAAERPLIAAIDRQRTEQVLFNLVDNAVKYSPEGGAVEVSVRRQADEAVVAITDVGLGVPSAEQARVFDRFYRASNVVETSISGMGVGLYISRAIVLRHGGRLWLEGRAEGGTAVFLTLPMVEAQS